jgi:lipoprotein-releasing system ATP-binding protein
MIEVSGVTKSYETPGEVVSVLEGVDLRVADGETAAIVGPSGSGKSTLLNILGALDRPTAGTVAIGGQDLAGFSDEEAAVFRNRSLGFIFQQHHLLPQLSVLENVLVPRLAGGWEESEGETASRARDLLEAVGLSERLTHRPFQLSGGEKLRTAVARALINEPQLVLADEPTGSLDEETTEKVAELLLELNRSRVVTLVMVTHNLPLAERMGALWELGGGVLTRKGS